MSMFATKSTSLSDVAELVDNLDRYMTAEGTVRTAEVATQPIKYSRAWLILRRAWIEANSPKLLVSPSKSAVAKAEKQYAATNPDWELRHVWGPIVVDLHDNEACSWGEIMVRTGQAEGYVRKAYRLAATGEVRDVGLRTGKGGRFVADRPDLYLENRKAEGAVIPQVERPRTVAIEALLNFQPQG